MQAITKFSLLTLPILIVTIDTKIFYQLSLLICHQKIHGDEIYFAKFALSKQNGCINLLHNSGIFAECATLSFLRWQKQCNFKRKKKVTSSLTHTRPNNSRHRKKNQMLATFLSYEFTNHKREKVVKYCKEIPHTWGALSATRIGLWLGEQVGEVGRLICNESANSMPTSWCW
jgi:hypothetical protein